jgi:hypothetical protein
VVIGAIGGEEAGLELGVAGLVASGTLVIALADEAGVGVLLLLDKSLMATMQNTPATMPDHTLYAVLKPALPPRRD